MNFNAGESKSTTNDVHELTTELQAVAGGFSGLALERAVEIYLEQQRLELYRDRI